MTIAEWFNENDASFEYPIKALDHYSFAELATEYEKVFGDAAAECFTNDFNDYLLKRSNNYYIRVAGCNAGIYEVSK